MKTNELRQTKKYSDMVLMYGPAVELYIENFTNEDTWECDSPESFEREFKSKYKFNYAHVRDFTFKMLQKATIAEPLKYYIDFKRYHDDLMVKNGGDFVSFEKDGFYWLFEQP